MAVAAVLAILVPGVPLLVGLFLHGGSPGAATVQTTQTAAYTPVAGHNSGHHTRAAAASHSRANSALALPGGSGALIGYVSQRTKMRSRPGGHAIAVLQTKTGFGSPTYVLVRHVKGHWLGVVDTAAGNNHIGWIRATGVNLERDVWSIHAHLSRHNLDVYHDGKLVQHFPIATGKPTAPTPTGLFAVTDRLSTGDPEGPYGCCILALSAKAPHQISDWDGGNRIAIHSTPETDSIGYSVSHGCMRLSLADGQWLIRHIPLATPVRVSSA
jgi:lipoprotein-anchoring transpeptidase ErfK/SrfK